MFFRRKKDLKYFRKTQDELKRRENATMDLNDRLLNYMLNNGLKY